MRARCWAGPWSAGCRSGWRPLALLFLVRGEGWSYGAAGVVVAVYAVAVGVGAPVCGPPGRPVRPDAGAAASGRSSYALFAGHLSSRWRCSTAGIAPIAARPPRSPGSSLPPLSSTVRIVWPRLAPDRAALDRLRARGLPPGGVLSSAGRCSRPALAKVGPAAVGRRRRARELVGVDGRPSLLPPVRQRRRPRAPGGAGLLGALRVPRRPHGGPLRGHGGGGVGFGRARDAGVRRGPRVARARWARARVLLGWEPRSAGLVAGMRPPRERAAPVRGSARSGSPRRCSPCSSRLDPHALLLAFVAGLPIAPTIGGRLLPHRPLRAGGHRGGGVRVVRHGHLRRHRGGVGARGGVLVDERGVRAAFAAGAAVAFVRRALRLGRRGTCARPHAAEPGYPDRRAPVAQGTERRTSNPRVGGSNPPGRIRLPANAGLVRRPLNRCGTCLIFQPRRSSDEAQVGNSSRGKPRDA